MQLHPRRLQAACLVAVVPCLLKAACLQLVALLLEAYEVVDLAVVALVEVDLLVAGRVAGGLQLLPLAIVSMVALLLAAPWAVVLPHLQMAALQRAVRLPAAAQAAVLSAGALSAVVLEAVDPSAADPWVGPL